MHLCIDFETRSVVDLQTCGAFVYAMHPSTEIFCLSVKVDNQPSRIWVNPKYLPFASHGLPLIELGEVAALVQQAEHIEAHNAQFEAVIWLYVGVAKYGFPELPIDKLRCSAAQAAYNALPRSLDPLGEALESDVKKDHAGYNLIRKLSLPQAWSKAEFAELDNKYTGYAVYDKARAMYKSAKSGKAKAFYKVICDNWQNLKLDGYDPQNFIKWDNDPQALNSFYKYCLRDTDTEYAVSNMMPALPESEVRVWKLDQTINRRGLLIDRQGAHNAIAMVEEYSARLTKELKGLTKNKVQTARQGAALIRWCAEHDVVMPDTQKATIAYFLKQDVPDNVRRVLEIRAALNKSSISKYQAALNASSVDGYLRGWSMYHAAATGRWSSSLMQLHNMPRGTVKLNSDERINEAYAVMSRGADWAEFIYGDPMGLASSAIRGLITAPADLEFYCSDFASVEGRVLAWCAGEEHVLDHYRQGRDMYIVAATSIYGGTYDELYAEYKIYEATQGAQGTKAKRTVGKPTELGLGYGGGIGAFVSMAKVYGIDLETLPAIILPTAEIHELEQASRTAKSYLETLEKRIKLGYASMLDRMSLEAATACDVIKQRWRRDRKRTVSWWYQLEEAAKRAIENPGYRYDAGPVGFGVDANFLMMQLPSGRLLRYHKPKLHEKKKFGRLQQVITFKGMKTEGGTTKKYQTVETYGGKLSENAVQAISADLLRLSMLRCEASGYPVVLDVHDEDLTLRKKGTGSVEELNEIMSVTPKWAAGLPIAASGWKGQRYRKD